MGLGLGPSPCHPLTGCQDSENTICVNPHPEACSKHPDFLTGDIGGGGHVQPLQSDGPPEPGPPGWVGQHPTPRRWAPKPTPLRKPQRPGTQGPAPAAQGTVRTQVGARAPHILHHLLAGRPLGSLLPPQRPAPRSVVSPPLAWSRMTAWVTQASFIKACGGHRDSHVLPWGGPARLEGRRLQDSSPRGRGCQADHSPQGPPSHGAGSKSPHQTLLPTGDWSRQQKRLCRTLHPGSTGGASTGQIHATERARDDLRNVHCKTPQSD